MNELCEADRILHPEEFYENVIQQCYSILQSDYTSSPDGNDGCKSSRSYLWTKTVHKDTFFRQTVS